MTGGWLPKRNEEQKKEYRNADPEEKEDLNRQLGRQQRADCQEKNCDNDATNFPSSGLFGWCIAHNPEDDEDD